MTKGIGTESFGVLALGEAGDAKRAAGNEAAGAKRYSARTNRPSGGMNESDLSRAQRWSLVCPISNQNHGERLIVNIPYARMERAIRQDLGIRKRQETVGNAYVS